jgi:hypothetical protein
MSEEREAEKAAADAEGRSAEASAPRGREENWPPDDWDEADWEKSDWNEDNRPDEVLLDALLAEETDWAEDAASRPTAAEAFNRTTGPVVAGTTAGAASPSLPEESQAETTRRSGIAYAAGFTLFLTVVSFMGLGWLLDNWLGTRWLLVAGIVIGAVAGFTQFLRIITRLK